MVKENTDVHKLELEFYLVHLKGLFDRIREDPVCEIFLETRKVLLNVSYETLAKPSLAVVV